MAIWSIADVREDLSDRQQHRSTWRIAAPMLLSNMTVPLVGLVDSAVMGHLPEPYHLAAVGLGAALFTFIVWTMGFLRMITTGLVAQAYGAGNHYDIRQWLYLSSILALSVALFTLLLNPWIIDLILWWVEGSNEVEQSVLLYWNTRIWGLPFTLLNAVMIGWFIGMQNARVPFVMLLIINLCNAGLDFLFVQGFGMAVDGVAIASVISEILGFIYAAICLRSLLKKYPIKEKLQLALLKLKRLLRLNGDLLLRTLSLELVFFTIHSRGAELGNEVMAVNAVLLNFLLVISNGLDGFANAVEAQVGRALGRDSWREFRASINVGGFWSIITSLLFCLIFLLFVDTFIGWITDIESVRNQAEPYHIYIILIPLVAIWGFWLDGVFVGASAITTMRNSMILAVVIGFIPLYFLTKDYGNHGLWWAFFAFLGMRALTSFWLLYKGILEGRYISLERIKAHQI
ncbi:MATE family efflux transporter [Kangiella sediminilitoris]|uniref:MATE efflux family protein n=1 Tax=Kangiella sediminilitoris TaxID=1144748 RepID=A0A1B3B877_9GAMM|nr:MATE family efflux transporter [Kangiella sediminilitoris]AOE49002.1 MATE efflux family protein [Kangiella sediminilitoris]